MQTLVPRCTSPTDAPRFPTATRRVHLSQPVNVRGQRTSASCESPAAPGALSESELPGWLHDGLQKFAHDIRGSGVLLIQDLHIPCRSSQVAVAEPVPYPL